MAKPRSDQIYLDAIKHSPKTVFEDIYKVIPSHGIQGAGGRGRPPTTPSVKPEQPGCVSSWVASACSWGCEVGARWGPPSTPSPPSLGIQWMGWWGLVRLDK